MIEIPFTQYLLPHGREKAIFINRDDLVGQRAGELIEDGLRFESEILRSGEVSLTIHDPETDEDIAIEITQNGPDVPKAVDRLILGFKAEEATGGA